MLKNFKHSIKFILVTVTLLLVVVMSLAASRPVSQVGEKGVSSPINPIINGKWSGLGTMIWCGTDTALFDSDVDTLLANGFTELRLDMADLNGAEYLARSKAAAIRAIAKGVKIIWGISQCETVITAENWEAYRAAVKSAAQWAQDNGVFEFQLGNELEYNTQYNCAAGTLVRSSNVVTVTTPVAHGFDGTHQVHIWGATPDDMNGIFTITVTSPTTFTYTANGADGSNSVRALVYTMTYDALIANLKSLATEVQAIFTSGNISYSTGYWTIPDWVSAGKGDLDLLAANVYMSGNSGLNTWQTYIDSLISTFGANGTYLTEFSLSSYSLDDYSTNETTQAAGVATMINYIKASGMTRALFFSYRDADWLDGYGVRKDDGTYRLLWNALNSNNATLDTTAPNITGLSDDTTTTIAITETTTQDKRD